MMNAFLTIPLSHSLKIRGHGIRSLKPQSGLEAAFMFEHLRDVDGGHPSWSVEAEDLVLLNSHVERPYACQRLANAGSCKGIFPTSRHHISAGLQILHNPVKAVGRNCALIKCQEAPASYCHALGGKCLEKISADLDVSRVIGDRGTRNYLWTARASYTHRKIHSGECGTAHAAR